MAYSSSSDATQRSLGPGAFQAFTFPGSAQPRSWPAGLACLLLLLLAGAGTYAQAPLQETTRAQCVGATSTVTLVIPGNPCSVTNWQVTGSGYTIASSSTSQIVLRWNVANATALISPTLTCGSNTASGPSLSLSGPAPSVSIAGPPSPVCTGNALSFTATPTQGGGSPTYQWSVNGTPVSGATGATFSRTFTTAGTYTVLCSMQVNGTGCTPTTVSNQVSVTVQEPVTPPAFLPTVTIPSTTPTPPGSVITPTVVTLCGGGSVVLSSPQAGTAYQWRRDGTPISEATSATYTTSANGSYSVVIPASGCTAAANSDAVLVTLTSTMGSQTPGAIQGPAEVCPGQTYTYSIPPLAGASAYAWTLPPGASGSSTTNTLSLTFGASASGSLSVRGLDACGQSLPASLSISPRRADPLTSLTLTAAQLQSQLKALLYLNTCSQVNLNTCQNRLVTKATLQALFNTGEIHTLPLGPSTATATVTFTVEGLNSSGQVVFQGTVAELCARRFEVRPPMKRNTPLVRLALTSAVPASGS